jgi:hypothetical protein
MENPWANLPLEAPFVAPVDEPYLPLLAERCPGMTFELLPAPFAGDPQRARIVFLLLNPGFASTDIADEQDPDWARDCRSMLTFTAEPPFAHLSNAYANEDGSVRTGGARWWRQRLRRLAQTAGGYEALAESCLCLEFVGYHSQRFTPLPGLLPSQEFTFGLLRSLIERDVAVVAGRHHDAWRWYVPELVEHEQRGRVVRLRNPQQQAVSPGNMNAPHWEAVTRALS